MRRPPRILTILFGHIGDTLITLSLFDDILSYDPDATFLILTKRNPTVVRDLAAAYPRIEVKQIPDGVKSIPFFISLLLKSRIFLALGMGSSIEYSLRLKIFIFVFSLIPGRRSIGLDGRSRENKGWQPVKTIVPTDRTITMLNNFRSLIPFINSDVFNKDTLASITTRPLYLELKTVPPQNVPWKNQSYIVAHLFGVSRNRSLPIHRWKSLFTQITQQYPDLSIVFTGSLDDKKALEEIAHIVPHSYIYVDRPLLEVAGLIKGAALYMGVDTGITHLAGVLKQKSVVVRHVGDPRWMPTYNPNARILINSTHCTCLSTGNCTIDEDGTLYTRCLYEITDAFILDSVTLALSTSDNEIPSFSGIIDENHTGAI